ncbi:MAG: hypothetical protein J4428_00075 [Candidatus Aenigmarchaeota archaeon]|nr:hypothetical protein [Candidatus Aenigmarchaeota archaeon]
MKPTFQNFAHGYITSSPTNVIPFKIVANYVLDRLMASLTSEGRERPPDQINFIGIKEGGERVARRLIEYWEYRTKANYAGTCRPAPPKRMYPDAHLRQEERIVLVDDSLRMGDPTSDAFEVFYHYYFPRRGLYIPIPSCGLVTLNFQTSDMQPVIAVGREPEDYHWMYFSLMKLILENFVKSDGRIAFVGQGYGGSHTLLDYYRNIAIDLYRPDIRELLRLFNSYILPRLIPITARKTGDKVRLVSAIEDEQELTTEHLLDMRRKYSGIIFLDDTSITGSSFLSLSEMKRQTDQMRNDNGGLADVVFMSLVDCSGNQEIISPLKITGL